MRGMHINLSHILRMAPAGLLQDFCPICRSVRSFRIFALQGGMKIHSWIHGVPRNAGDRILACQHCGFYRTDAGVEPRVRVPAQLAAESAEGVRCTDTIRSTSRMDLEDRMRRGQLSTVERVRLIEEPIRLVQAMGRI